MSDQVFDNVPVRVVRSESQGAYLVQVGVDGVYRNIGGFKLGKVDALRAAQAAEPASKSRSKK